MISKSIYACFQILLIFSLFIMLLYTCNWIEVNKILFTLNFFICQYFSFYEQLKFRAKLSWVWKVLHSRDRLQQVSSADSLRKKFGPRSGLTKCLIRSGSNLIDWLKAQSTIFQSCRDNSHKEGDRKEEWYRPPKFTSSEENCILPTRQIWWHNFSVSCSRECTTLPPTQFWDSSFWKKN